MVFCRGVELLVERLCLGRSRVCLITGSVNGECSRRVWNPTASDWDQTQWGLSSSRVGVDTQKAAGQESGILVEGAGGAQMQDSSSRKWM